MLASAHRRTHFLERLRRVHAGPFDIWVHGASVGEILALEALLGRHRHGGSAVGIPPEIRVLITVNTVAARAAAKNMYPRASVQLAPLDWGPVLRGFLGGLKLKLHLLSELDIWPSRQRELSRRGIPTMVAGARMSERGYRRTRLAWPLMGEAYRGVQHWACRDEASRERLASLGLDPARLSVTGSLKFDALLEPLDPGPEADRLGGDLPWVVAGSLHPGEEGPFLELAQSGKCRVLMAPRHLHKRDHFEAALRAAGLQFSTWSAWKGEPVPVVLLDGMGLLGRLYARAAVAFVGGSLVDIGGHNMLEPARFGVSVVVGPHTHHFKEEMQALRREGGVVETTSTEAASVILDLLSNFPRREELGCRSRKALESLAGGTSLVLAQVLKTLK